jgi:hypothetical protein
LAAGRSGDTNYNAAAEKTSINNVTVGKATPELTGLAATGIKFGQRLSASTPSVAATGVGGEAVTGNISWAADNTVIPGNDDIELNTAGYQYAVAFTPTGASAANYLQNSGTATVAVAKATPYMNGAPTGTTIFTYTSQTANTLADSIPSGVVYYSKDGIAREVSGTWTWADPALSYTEAGLKYPIANFTPGDQRVDAYSAAARVAVFSPKTSIQSAPNTGNAVYGGYIQDVSIGEGGAVYAVPAEADAQNTDISELGTWSWKDPQTRITAPGGTQQATLVFTPSHELDWSNPDAGGYVAAECTVTLTVDRAQLTIANEGTVPPTIEFEQQLQKSDITSGLGYIFAGTDMDGEILGTLAWESPEIAVAAAGAKEDGIYNAAAVFTPAPKYADRYAPFKFTLPVTVVAKTVTKTELAKDANVARAAAVRIASDTENYDEKVIEKLKEMIAEVDEALKSENLTQAKANTLLSAVEDAMNALTHSHPILENSASDPLTVTGAGITVRIKGSFNSVKSLTLNGSAFGLSRISDKRYDLSMDKAKCGKLTEGSAIITLDPAYVDGLDNGTYTIELLFRDGYMDGKGAATFVIDRNQSEDGGIRNETPQNSAGTGNGSAGTGSAGNTGKGNIGTGAGNAEESTEQNPNATAPDSPDADGDNGATAPNPEREDAQDSTGIPAAIFIAIAMILLLGALFIILAVRRRRRTE